MYTIFAPATPPGRSGVAVTRISGPAAASALAALGVAPLPSPRLAVLARLRHPQGGGTIDRALVLWFPAPASFTGEDVAELHVHGGRAVTGELLEVLSGLPGLRFAEPGEFARRAFMNGKMDLTSAEGLSDLIDAETASQKRQAMRAMEGEMAAFYAGLRQGTLHLLALLEAYIDFPDEEIPESVLGEVELRRGEMVAAIAAQLRDNRAGERIREGLRAAIVGPPNSGKSTLLNALAGREAAIVSAEAGTTRDVIEVRLDAGGVALTLADTAGIREAAGAAEAEGVARALAAARDADILLLVFDPFSSSPPMGERGGVRGIMKVAGRENTLILLNKSDLGPLPSSGWAASLRGYEPLAISARGKQGLDALLDWLKARAAALTTAETLPVITRLRHRRALAAALSHLQALAGEKALELRCEHLRRAATEIGGITGAIAVEEILGEIFGRFCIGK